MAREPVERELQHYFRRTGRPSAFALYILEAFEKAAGVEQEPAEFRADRIERLVDTLARGNHRLGERSGALATGAAASGGNRARPVRGGARHQMGASEIAAQPLTRLELVRLDQRAAVASAAARKPGERAFGFVDGDAGAAELGRDLALGKVEMLAEKGIDSRLLRFWRADWGFLA
jgi:hypothetical protein